MITFMSSFHTEPPLQAPSLWWHSVKLTCQQLPHGSVFITKPLQKISPFGPKPLLNIPGMLFQVKITLVTIATVWMGCCPPPSRGGSSPLPGLAAHHSGTCRTRAIFSTAQEGLYIVTVEGGFWFENGDLGHHEKIVLCLG